MGNTIYLVTGAAGFLGGTVCRQLIQRGERVRALVLPNDPSLKYVPSEVQIVLGDLCDIASLERFFQVSEGDETILLHIASIVTVDPEFNQKVIDVNVGGTQNLIELCLKHPECKKMVYCSSTGAIPEEKKGKKIAETNFFDENKVIGCYSQSKALASQAMLDAVNTKGLNACIVHPSGILGPGDYAGSETTNTVIDIIQGAMPIGIAGSFNLCDVRDLAAGTIAAADCGVKGSCYILANEEVPFRDFSKMLSEEAGCKKVKFFLPIGLANQIAKVLESRAKKRGEKPKMTTFSVYNLARNNAFDSSKAQRELGYKTRSYQETIRDQIQWLKKEGRI